MTDETRYEMRSTVLSEDGVWSAWQELPASDWIKEGLTDGRTCIAFDIEDAKYAPFQVQWRIKR